MFAPSRKCRKLASPRPRPDHPRSEEHTSELQSRQYLVCRLLLEKKNRAHVHLLYHPQPPHSPVPLRVPQPRVAPPHPPSSLHLSPVVLIARYASPLGLLSLPHAR